MIDSQTKGGRHQRSAGDANEHQRALEVWQEWVLTGRVVTADAAFCHQDVCQTIVDGGGHDARPVTDNQPPRPAALEREFAAANAVRSSHEQGPRRAAAA